MTHYSLDIEHNCIYKHISRSNNYDVICYIHHDNHLYLIKDKKFIQKISQSRSNVEKNIMVNMCNASIESTTNELTGDILKNIPVNELENHQNSIIIYSKKNLKQELFDLYVLLNEMPKHTSFDNKITKIVIKRWNIKMFVDPNVAIDHPFKENDKTVTLDYTHVQQLCKTFNIPFKNQSITSFIRQFTYDKLHKTTERIKFTKEERCKIRKQQHNMCKICGVELQRLFHINHIKPLACNGTNDKDNLQGLCISCHQSKTKDEHENGTYYNLPAFASTFNQNVLQNVTSTDEFQQFAFVERLDGFAKKHTN